MTLERIEMDRPEAPKRRKPGVDLHEGLGPDAVETPLGINARLHESGLTQDSQVLGNGGLRHPQLLFDIPHGPLR
jgi:hypothetical protein